MLLPHLQPLFALLATQAGGGGSFGGGGGGFGGGGDDDGIAMLLWFLVRLAIEVPALGVPLLIAVVVGLFASGKLGRRKHQESVIRRKRPVREARAAAGAANALRQADPTFDEARFLGRVEQAFRAAQEGWCAQDLERLRAFVSDGVYERFSLQVEEQKRDGWRQGMEGLSVGALSILQAQSGAQFDTVTVRIPFRARIDRRRREGGERVPNSLLPRESFVECWSFLRRRGAQTLSGAGLMEGQCPNCGAPIELNQSARCGHCECLMRSGRFDWVLSEITQESEWRPEREVEVPGYARFVEQDPGLSVQMLEDRASVAFWRKCAADRSGATTPLARMGEASFCKRYAEQLAPGSDGVRTYAADCAVGSVRTLGLLLGTELDRAVIEVVWDGVRAREEAGGDRRLDDRRVLRRSLFVFGRPPGLSSSLDEALTTAHCTNCGAHDTGGTDPSCAYCGAPRTGGAGAWLLYGIWRHDSPEAQRLRMELSRASSATGAAPQVQSAEGLLAWAIELVLADGRIDPGERSVLRTLAEREGIRPTHLEALLDGERRAAPQPLDEAEGRAWLARLHELAMADGAIDKHERRFLAQAAERLGLSSRESRRTSRDARMRLFLDSR